MTCRQQGSRRGSAAIVCLLLTAVGACAYGPQVVWTGDDWSVTVPCGGMQPTSLTYYVREMGHVLADSVSGEQNVKISQSLVGNHICCLAENDSTDSYQSPEECYIIKHTNAPHPVEPELPTLPVFGQYFEMKCPVKSSAPGTLYYWQRYTTIDRSTEIDFPMETEFSEDGRVWSTDVLSAEHNGLYVCWAVNKWGEEEYDNVVDFFISVSACANHAPHISVSISPTGEVSTYEEGDSVEMVCTAMAVDTHEQPFWYHDQPPSPTPCGGQDYQLRSSFDESSCQWTTILTIPEFTNSTVGTYICSVGEYGANKTLTLERASSEECHLGVSEPIGWMIVCVLTLTVTACVPVVFRFTKFNLLLQTTEEPPYDGFMYDAFVSAHSEVSDFVLENILPRLESGPAPYRLCWHSRDFIPGIPIMEQIARAMAKSRKVIFVFSEHFSQSQFCCAELELAMNRYMSSCTRCILPVAMGGEHVPDNVRETITYLPVLSAGERDVAGKIAKVMGQPIPAPVPDRLNDTLVEE